MGTRTGGTGKGRLGRGALLGACALAALPGALGAQGVVGVVTEAASGRPVAGAMVRAILPDGSPGPAFLTAEDGRFRLLLPGPVTLGLRVERIGFEEVVRGPVEVGAGELLRFDLVVRAAPVRLEGLAVSARRARGCLPGAEEGAATQRLWDEARKALAAAAWTEEHARLRFRIERTVRRLDTDGRTVIDEARGEAEAVGRHPVRTLPPAELARGGWVREEAGLLTWHGPDAAALLSDAFLGTHCFGVAPGEGEEAGLVGLTFEPVPGRDTTDVRGVLWIEPVAARLERIDFGYTGVEELPGHERAGGSVRFAELPDGRWVVRAWTIRAPLLSSRSAATPRRTARRRTMLAGIHEEGSEIVAVAGPDGLAWSRDRSQGAVRGVVWDSAGSRPLAGAEVRLAGRGWRARADATGSWRIAGVPEGSYRISFTHPLLDSLDLDPGWREVRVREGRETEVGLAVPPLERILALGCDGPAVVGVVRDAGGEPLPGADVRVVRGLAAGSPGLGATSGARGSYRICGAPPGGGLGVQASVGPALSPVVEARVAEEGATRVDLAFPAPVAEGEEAREDEERVVLQGTVTDLRSGEPVEGALVELLDGDRVAGERLTDGEGRFVLFPGPGRYRARVSHLAYAAERSGPLELRTGTHRLEARLAPEAFELEGILVSVPGRLRHLDEAGFYRRENQGLGTFLDRNAILALTPAKPSDVLARNWRMSLFPDGTGARMGRDFYFRRAAMVWGMCLPLVYVDGIVQREGGESEPFIDQIVSLEAIEAMELYPSAASVPVRFTGPGSNCGVIVIWTRRGPGA